MTGNIIEYKGPKAPPPDVPPVFNTCENCCSYQSVDGHGVCTHYPPQFLRDNEYGYWPKVKPLWSCAQHVRKGFK